MFHEFAGPVGRLSLRWAGFEPRLDDSVRQLFGMQPESSPESLQFVWEMKLWAWRFISGFSGGLGAVGGQKLTKRQVK